MKETFTPNITDELWGDNDTERFSNDTFHTLLMEQYKVYVEMADRTSARRSLANTFFLTIHAIILSVLGFSIINNPSITNPPILLFPLLGLLVLCYAWWRLVQYFRRLSRAKGAVIAELEKRLPSTSLDAERVALGEHQRPYNPLKRMEVTLPFIFGLLYIFSYLYVAVF